MQIIKPGIHWDSVHLRSHEVLVSGFLRLGIFKSGASPAELLQAGLSAAFYPHGLGHSLGLDVHDVPSASKPSGSGKDSSIEPIYDYLRLRVPLQAGMVVVRSSFHFFSVRRNLQKVCRLSSLGFTSTPISSPPSVHRPSLTTRCSRDTSWAGWEWAG
jgi:hypothetical protein